MLPVDNAIPPLKEDLAPVPPEDSLARESDSEGSHVEIPHSAGNWSKKKKLFVVATGLFLNTNATLGSSLPSGATDAINAHFNITDPQQFSLPVAVFLIGYVFGPIFFGPLSETYGRWPCLVISFTIYTCFTLACALAQTWPSFLVFRLICGIGAGAPQTMLGAVFADIYPDLHQRGRAVTPLAMLATIGPLIGPIIAGYTSVNMDWTWQFWISLILAGANWPMLIFMPETFEPAIRKKLEKSHASKAEKAVPGPPAQAFDIRKIVVVTLTRPMRMFLEPMVLFTDLFLVLEYSMFFLYFEAYPYIFKDMYGLSPGDSALMLIPVGFGVFLAMLACYAWDDYLIKAKAKGRAWAHQEEYRRLPLVCVGGPLNGASQFWLAWSSRPDVHWAVPMLSGVLFGFGVDLIFMGLTNYLTDAYDVYSASAMASSVFSRNIAAALLLPLASHQMYVELGVAWSCSILGFAALAMSIIPFAFIKYGAVLKERSPFCQRLLQQKLTGGYISTDL